MAGRADELEEIAVHDQRLRIVLVVQRQGAARDCCWRVLRNVQVTHPSLITFESQ